jgi:hypothetical protein
MVTKKPDEVQPHDELPPGTDPGYGHKVGPEGVRRTGPPPGPPVDAPIYPQHIKEEGGGEKKGGG